MLVGDMNLVHKIWNDSLLTAKICENDSRTSSTEGMCLFFSKGWQWVINFAAIIIVLYFFFRTCIQWCSPSSYVEKGSVGQEI